MGVCTGQRIMCWWRSRLGTLILMAGRRACTFVLIGAGDDWHIQVDPDLGRQVEEQQQPLQNLLLAKKALR